MFFFVFSMLLHIISLCFITFSMFYTCIFIWFLHLHVILIFYCIFNVLYMHFHICICFFNHSKTRQPPLCVSHPSVSRSELWNTGVAPNPYSSSTLLRAGPKPSGSALSLARTASSEAQPPPCEHRFVTDFRPVSSCRD